MGNSEYFRVKLDELEDRYLLMKKELLLNKNTSHESVRQKMKQMSEFSEHELKKMEETIARSNSKAIAAISSLQKEYNEKMNELVQYHLDQWMIGKDELELKMEEVMLCAEYAIDYMIQTMNHTTLAVLRAVDVQMTDEERETER